MVGKGFVGGGSGWGEGSSGLLPPIISSILQTQVLRKDFTFKSKVFTEPPVRQIRAARAAPSFIILTLPQWRSRCCSGHRDRTDV